MWCLINHIHTALIEMKPLHYTEHSTYLSISIPAPVLAPPNIRVGKFLVCLYCAATYFVFPKFTTIILCAHSGLCGSSSVVVEQLSSSVTRRNRVLYWKWVMIAASTVYTTRYTVCSQCSFRNFCCSRLPWHENRHAAFMICRLSLADATDGALDY